MKVGIILAAGKGTRFGATDTNKTVALYLGRPMVCYGADLLSSVCDKLVVVTGFAKESVESALKDYKNVIFAEQVNPNGTGHALQVAIDKIKEENINPSAILLGYGDHMMFYDQVTIEKVMTVHQENKSAITLVTTRHHDPNALAWGRIIRDPDDNFQRIVEQKAATEDEMLVTELNAGLYVFDYDFAQREVKNILPTPPANELYLTDLIEIAVKQELHVSAVEVPFEKVGIGINSREEIQKSEELYNRTQENSER